MISSRQAGKSLSFRWFESGEWAEHVETSFGVDASNKAEGNIATKDTRFIF